MTAPFISIIVPCYNHSDSLGVLFESIICQSVVADIEVILVDDCSDQGCEPSVAEWRDQGPNFRVLRLDRRHYTKNARLAGIEAATGEVIAFADADDILWGDDALERHALRLTNEKADILHFPSVLLNAEYRFLSDYPLAGPFGERLEGADIFAAYVRTSGHRSTIWSKIYSKRLAKSVVAEARKSSVRRYREDILLTSYLFFHAGAYLGDDQAGYGHRRTDKDAIKAGGRALSSWHMLQELVPYLEENGCSRQISDLFAAKLKKFMEKSAATMFKTLHDRDYPCLSDSSVKGMLEHGDFGAIMKMFSFLAGKQK